MTYCISILQKPPWLFDEYTSAHFKLLLTRIMLLQRYVFMRYNLMNLTAHCVAMQYNKTMGVDHEYH